jgi:hypothetical protein
MVRFAALLAALQFASGPAAASPAREARGYPEFAASYTLVPDAAIESAGTGSELEAKETQLAAGLFEWRRPAWRVDLGLDYQYTRYIYDNIDGRNRDLHRLQFPVGIDWRSRKWSFSGFVAPGIATSSNVLKDVFERSSGDDFLITARLEALYPHSSSLSWLGGIAYDRAFGEARPYPIIGLIYAPSRQSLLRLALPDSSLQFRMGDRHRAGLRLFPAGFEWHVVSDELDDRFWYRVEGIRLQGSWSVRVAGAAWLDLSLGYEFRRRHEFVDDLGRSIRSDVGSELLFTAGLRWGDGPVPHTHGVTRRAVEEPALTGLRQAR